MSDFYLLNLWRRSAGMDEIEYKSKPPLEELKRTQWSPYFEKCMRNRLIMGALRYGLIHQKNKPIYDRLESIEKRLTKYKKTGNDELLVDIANLALLEFEEGIHPQKHFQSQDDRSHVKEIIWWVR